MTPAEIAYLAMVCIALSLFAVVLAFVSWYARPGRVVAQQKARAERTPIDVSPPTVAAH